MPCNYSKYPPNWKSEIRPRILKRADNKCEHCFTPNGIVILRGKWKGLAVYQDMDGYIYQEKDSKPLGGDYLGEVDPSNKNNLVKVVLTIAHMDHDPENWNVKDDRLAALCQQCHFRYDALVNKAKKARKKYRGSLFPL